jgi:hypothetical protein
MEFLGSEEAAFCRKESSTLIVGFCKKKLYLGRRSGTYNPDERERA